MYTPVRVPSGKDSSCYYIGKEGKPHRALALGSGDPAPSRDHLCLPCLLQRPENSCGVHRPTRGSAYQGTYVLYTIQVHADVHVHVHVGQCGVMYM